MLNNKKGANDYVIATGKLHCVRDFLEKAFNVVNLDYNKYVKFNEAYLRPSEKIPLVGDTSKIERDLSWQAQKNFDGIIEEMVLNDIKKVLSYLLRNFLFKDW